MRRGVGLTAVATAALLVVAACGGSDNGDDGTSAPPSAADQGTSDQPDTDTGGADAPETDAGDTDTAEPDAPSDLPPYKIGGLLGLTGAYANLGTNEQVAMQLFADQLNAEGGVNGRQLELVFADTTSSESEAVNQMRKLATQENVVAIIGPSSSGEGIAVKPISLAVQTPTIVAAASMDIISPVEEAKYNFKQFPSTDASLEAQLTYVQEQGWTKVAILAANNGYGQEPADELPNMVGDFGLELVATEMFDPAATNVTPQLSAVAQSDPDVVLVWAVNPANAIVAKNAKDMDFNAVLFNSPGAASPQYIEVAEDAADGTLVQGSLISVPEDVPEDNAQYEAFQRFLEAWNSHTDEAPNQFAGNGWDCMLILVNALESIDPSLTDTQQIRDAVRDSLEQNTVDVPGINAVYTFAPDRHGSAGIAGLAVLEVEDGNWKLVKGY